MIARRHQRLLVPVVLAEVTLNLKRPMLTHGKCKHPRAMWRAWGRRRLCAGRASESIAVMGTDWPCSSKRCIL